MSFRLFIICFVVALGGILFGFDTAVIAGANSFIKSFFHLNDFMLGWAASSAILGCIPGAAIAGKVADMFGRKRILIFSAVLFFISAIGSGLSNDITNFIIYRFIGGIAVGASSTIAPIYIAEVSPAKYRGRLVMFYQLAIVLGILLAFVSNYYLLKIEKVVILLSYDSYLSFINQTTLEGGNIFSGLCDYLLTSNGTDNWRWMLIAESGPAVLFFVFLFVIPESPRWLMQKGRALKAEKVLVRLSNIDRARQQLSEIKEALKEKVVAKLSDIFLPKYRKVLLLGVFLAIFAQLSGINVILYYAPMIFEEMGFNAGQSNFQAILLGLTNLVFTLLGMWLIDKVGRRSLLYSGSALMAVLLLGLSISFFMGGLKGIHMIILIIAYLATNSATWCSVIWVLLSEMFPNRLRGTLMSSSTFVVWIVCFLVSLTFPYALAKFGGGITFGFYVLTNTVAFIFVWFFIPETKGKTLEKIEEEMVN